MAATLRWRVTDGNPAGFGVVAQPDAKVVSTFAG